MWEVSVHQQQYYSLSMTHMFILCAGTVWFYGHLVNTYIGIVHRVILWGL